MSQYLSTSEDEVKEYLPRYRLLYITVAVASFIFLVNLIYLQIIKGEEFRYFSEKNLVKFENLYAPRGRILDRNGVTLVDNLPGFAVTITPQYAKKLEDTAKAISPVLDISTKKIIKTVKQERRKNGPYRPVRIKENLNRDEVARIERLRLDHPGLEIDMFIKRSYPFKENGAQLYGYVGEVSRQQLPRLNKGKNKKERFKKGDIIGKSGIESTADNKLRGIDGLDFVQVDALGRRAQIKSGGIFKAFQKRQDPIPGQNLVLSIDADLQQSAYHAMTSRERIGALVAMNPKNGEVLAWVNTPSFDPNEFATGISLKLWSKLRNDPFKPLRNKVIQDHTPPGSTFKAFTAMAGLEEGIINTKSTYHCPGKIRFGRKTYHCHLKYGHGAVNVFQALERSCDVFFYRLAVALGIDKMAKYAKALGVGEKTGVDIDGEIPGLMPTSKWKLKVKGEPWQPGENLSNAIGQGFVLMTPLQVATVFSGIAMDGPVYKPYVIKQILDEKENLIWQAKPEIIKNPVKDNIIKKENYEIVKKGLHMVNNGERGTAKWWKIPGVDIAGKTGTVQLFSLSADEVYAKCEERDIKRRHHGWFVGYAPAEKPEIVVAVLAEHSCHGSTGATPVVRDVIRTYIEKYFPEKILKKPRAKAPPSKKKGDI